MDITTVDLEPKQPILRLNESQRDIIRAAGTGAFSQEVINKERSAEESKAIAERIDKATWELVKQNPDAFHPETVFRLAVKFYKKEKVEERKQEWLQSELA